MSSNNKPPEEGINHQVQYVLSGLPTGRAAMAKEVRNFDEEKVKECKEDIDTLLVFAGLFSAVLSAFLLAAYPALQPDRMDVVVHALDRIATQTESYVTSGSTLTAANRLPSTLPPFQFSDNDIRVNVVWSASLIISLITASFAMLVKQWLREFLAVENPSPQARLRIHHFRAPQVTMWAVYEIAAALPLLLQLSLGLFFVGLCYFTVAVHSSIGYTTLPRVVGWALCFFTTTLLPFFFPRCPYKTALLKVVVVHLHRHISRWAVWLHGRSSTWRTQWFYSMPSLGQALQNAFNSLLVCLLAIPDERRVIEDPAKDVAILLSVDAIQANDELLSFTVFEALHYTEPHWKDVVDFTMGILSHRILSNVPSGNPGIETKWPFSDAFPLAKIRPRTKAAILRNLSEFIVDIGADFRNIDEDGTHLWQAFALVMSAAHDSPEHVIANPNLTSFLMCYLNHPRWAPKLLGDWMRLVDGTSNAHHDTGPVSLTTFQSILATLIRLEKSLQLRVPGGAEAFKRMFRMAYLTSSTADWDTWAWPQESLESWKTLCFKYLSSIVCEEFSYQAQSSMSNDVLLSASNDVSFSTSNDITLLRGTKSVFLVTLHLTRLWYESIQAVAHNEMGIVLEGVQQILAVAIKSDKCTSVLLACVLDDEMGYLWRLFLWRIWRQERKTGKSHLYILALGALYRRVLHIPYIPSLDVKIYM